MSDERPHHSDGRAIRRGAELLTRLPVPRPTAQFRRRAWLAFQRAIDPLAPPRPLPRPDAHADGSRES